VQIAGGARGRDTGYPTALILGNPCATFVPDNPCPEKDGSLSNPNANKSARRKREAKLELKRTPSLRMNAIAFQFSWRCFRPESW
jgi:hypothetical protein